MLALDEDREAEMRGRSLSPLFLLSAGGPLPTLSSEKIEEVLNTILFARQKRSERLMEVRHNFLDPDLPPKVRFRRHSSSFHSTESERNNQPFVRQKILERPKIFVHVSVLGTCTRFWYSSTVPRWSGGRSQRPGPRSSWCASRREVSTTVDRTWTWSREAPAPFNNQQSTTSAYNNKYTTQRCARSILGSFQLTFCHFQI